MSAANAAPVGRRSPPAVEVAGIARRFGYRWALRGVSLRIEAGEAVALLGRNGSGKTTLLRILATALRPSRGEGRVQGFDLVREADRIRASIGVLGHAPGLYGDLTASENLVFALRMAGRAPDAAALAEALDFVGLTREADERVRGFSAGMQRRLGLARLLLLKPSLLFLDEPYASFDVEGVERVNAFLTEHRAAGHTVIVSTHDLAKASGLVDRVVRLERGRLVEDASASAAATAIAATPVASTRDGDAATPALAATARAGER